MREVLRALGREADYTYDPPTCTPAAKPVTNPRIILSIMRDSTSYTLPSTSTIRQLYTRANTYGNISPGAFKRQKVLRQAVLGPTNSAQDFARFMDSTTLDLIQNMSGRLCDVSEFDVIKHVGTLSWARFVATLFCIPLKDSQNPKASMDCREFYDNMACVFKYIYRDEQLCQSARLKWSALKANKLLTEELEQVCEAIKESSFARILLHRDRKAGQTELMADHGDKLLQRLFDGGKSIQEVVSLVVLLATEIAVAGSFAVSHQDHYNCYHHLLTSQLSQITDTLFSEPYHTNHWPKIHKIAKDQVSSNSELLRIYVLEALRLSPPAAPFLRVSDTLPSISDWRYAQAIKKGNTLHLDIATASHDPTRFPHAEKIKLDRPQEFYLPFFDGPHGSLVSDIVVPGLVAQLRVLGKLKGLRRAPGTQGSLKRNAENGVVSFLSEAGDEWVPFPSSK